MVLKGTLLRVSDNSGGRTLKCIQVYNSLGVGLTGDIILGSIRKYRPHRKVSGGELVKAIIIRTTYRLKRKNLFISFQDNAVILINAKGRALGSRIFGPIGREVRATKNAKLLSYVAAII